MGEEMSEEMGEEMGEEMSEEMGEEMSDFDVPIGNEAGLSTNMPVDMVGGNLENENPSGEVFL